MNRIEELVFFRWARRPAGSILQAQKGLNGYEISKPDDERGIGKTYRGDGR
jgi:hypothetical protein